MAKNLTIRAARGDEYEAARAFYHSMIDAMQDLPYHPGWQKDVYPAPDFLQESIAQGELFIGTAAGEIRCAMVLNRRCEAPYDTVAWPSNAAHGRVFFLHALGVHPAYAGCGCAGALVAFALDRARQAGAAAVRLDVLCGNVPAERLYSSRGFEAVAERTIYYEDTGFAKFTLYEYDLLKDSGGSAILAARNNRMHPISAKGFSAAETEAVRRFHRSLVDVYGETPLVRLDALAAACGVGAVFVKDESGRFGLKAFKGLGGVWAMFCILCGVLGKDPATAVLEELREPSALDTIAQIHFVTTTDGNHGKGVAWAASLFGCRAHVYMPKGTVAARAEAVRAAGAGRAEATVTELGYDDCVRMTARLAAERGWYLIQDTAWEGYEQIPLWIMQGYTTMWFEAEKQLHAAGFARPTHLFLQAGVGAMAAAVAAAAVSSCPGEPPAVLLAEPTGAACFYDSVASGDGLPHAARSGKTIMAGLNCAEPCTLAWEILGGCARYAFACEDGVARHGMRLLARPLGSDTPVTSGESGAVTVGLLHLLATDARYAALRDAVGLDENAVVLLVSTEGDTDPAGYRRILDEEE